MSNSNMGFMFLFSPNLAIGCVVATAGMPPSNPLHAVFQLQTHILIEQEFRIIYVWI